MHASGPWYTSATTIGWTAIAVAVIFGVATIAPWWLGIRKRLLVYTAESASLLLTNELESSGAGDIKISLKGQAVDNPHLVTLTIASRSRKDIRVLDFDEGKPLQFHFDVPIVAAKCFAFDNQNAPEIGPNLAPPSVHNAPSQTIQIKPSLIRKGLWCRLHLLTEGPPRLTCENPIADVAVRRGTPATSKLIYAAITIQAGCLLFEGGIIANPHPGWPEVAIAIVLLLVATVIGGELVMAWRRRPS